MLSSSKIVGGWRVGAGLLVAQVCDRVAGPEPCLLDLENSRSWFRRLRMYSQSLSGLWWRRLGHACRIVCASAHVKGLHFSSDHH